TRHELVEVYDPMFFRTVALPLARTAALPSGLNGTVKNYDGELRTLHIRLMALYGSEVYETLSDANGTFSFLADEGLYMLVIIADGDKLRTLLESKPVLIPPFKGNQSRSI